MKIVILSALRGWPTMDTGIGKWKINKYSFWITIFSPFITKNITWNNTKVSPKLLNIFKILKIIIMLLGNWKTHFPDKDGSIKDLFPIALSLFLKKMGMLWTDIKLIEWIKLWGKDIVYWGLILFQTIIPLIESYFIMA